MTHPEKIATMSVTLQHARMSATLHGSNVKSVAIVNVHAIANVQMAVHVSVTRTVANQMSTDGTTVQTTTWTMISSTVSKHMVTYHVNAFNHVLTLLTNALLTVQVRVPRTTQFGTEADELARIVRRTLLQVMPHVLTDVRPTKKTANHTVHVMKTVPTVVHAPVGAVNFLVTPSGPISEIVAKTNVWSSGTIARNHVVMDKILKSA